MKYNIYPRSQDWILSKRKRVSDLLLCGCIMPFTLSIFLLALCLLILERRGKGPFFYKHMRVGQNGRLFMLHKMRTMVYRNGSVVVSPVGNVLSVLGADETPQLMYTIWRGDMALIGPRPLIPKDFVTMHSALGAQQYRDWRDAYVLCRPAWMGAFSQRSRLYLSQSQSYFEARHTYDVWYRQHASWHVDVYIFFRSLLMWCTDLRWLGSAIKGVLFPRTYDWPEPANKPAQVTQRYMFGK